MTIDIKIKQIAGQHQQRLRCNLEFRLLNRPWRFFQPDFRKFPGSFLSHLQKMAGPETGVRQETTKKNDHGLQLGDVVWARTMDGSLFWPASVARTSKGNLRLWKTGRFVHVKFFAPDKLDIPFNERWVAPCSGDVAPFEPQLLAGVAFEDSKLQESAYKAALHFYENQQTLSVVRRHLDAVACSTRTGGSASSTASAIRRRPPFARRPAAPQPIPSAPADRKSAWGPLSAMSNGRGHEKLARFTLMYCVYLVTC